MNNNDPEAIPLQKVVSAQSTGARRPSQSLQQTYSFPPESKDEKLAHSQSHRFRRGLRKRGENAAPAKEPEEGALNSIGKIYNKIKNYSLVTRYLFYILPLGIAFAIPLVLGATVAPKAKIGGVRLVWFFTWIEIVWVSFWVSKIVAHFLPKVFQFVVGIVSSKIRRYALMIRALEIPLSFIGWAVCSFLTFTPVVISNPDKDGVQRNWQRVLRQILAAILVCTIIFFVEKFIIQVISINYHNKQFGDKIKENKRNVLLLTMLYEKSKEMFPEYCQTFYHEDSVINDSLNIAKFSKKNSHKASGSVTPMRLIHNIGRAGDTVTAALGNGLKDMTGNKLFDSGTSLAIVNEALEKQRASEAMAKRIWMSFVCEGNEILHVDDLMDVLGADKIGEAEECFLFLDKDANGDVSMDEMVLMVRELGRSIKSIYNSKHDVDQALKVLDRMLLAVVLIVCVLVFIAFLNQNFVTSLATAGTAILSLSFVFAATAQEVLGSCIFLFVKHPFDVGDRVDLQTSDQLTVEHISLLFTVFKRINNGKLVQVPNIVLNGLWVENITRSKAMREQIQLFVNFDTTFEDVEALRQEMVSFVTATEHSRDFLPDIEIQVTGLSEMNKMELRIECCHKSNWSNETIRAQRRSKFMCALVAAIRKVPIYGPGGGGAALGSMDAPSYSVAVSTDDAAKFKEAFNDTKEAKRLIPTKKHDDVQSVTGTDYSGVTAHQEIRAMQALNSRSPAVDRTRDDTFNQRTDNRNDGSETAAVDERRSIEEVRGMLHRESTRGKRHPGQLAPISEPPTQQTYPMVPQSSSSQYAPPPVAGAPQLPMIPGNAFSGPNSPIQPGLSRVQGFGPSSQGPPPGRGR